MSENIWPSKIRNAYFTILPGESPYQMCSLEHKVNAASWGINKKNKFTILRNPSPPLLAHCAQLRLYSIYYLFSFLDSNFIATKLSLD